MSSLIERKGSLQKYDLTMLATAKLWADHGTCSRLRVGVVFSKASRILVQGYNGAPSGLPHCDHECDCSPIREEDGFRQGQINVKHMDWCNSEQPCDVSVHAEQNGVAWAARTGVALEGTTCTSTHQPCLVCARLLISAGVIRVVYEKPYRRVEGLNLLREVGLEVFQIDPTIPHVPGIHRNGRYPWGSGSQ